MNFRWVPVTPLEHPCPTCNGSGSEWATRKDGQNDRRYFFPTGPCPTCHGSREVSSHDLRQPRLEVDE